MPTGTPYQGHIPPYPAIRVDAFSVPREGDYHTTHLHLLTHTHTDHIVGLESMSFGQLVVCSQDAKSMLLRAEKYPDRIAFDQKRISQKVRPWAHLRTYSRIGRKNGLSRDLLRPIALNAPERYQLDGEEVVTVTAIDANHCPGSVMYLIEGSKGAVLHTGDMRAEPSFVENLKRNPFLAKYILPDPELDFRTEPASQDNSKHLYTTLEAIYLDTACLIGTVDVPTKIAATSGLIQLMGLYSVTTRFFINIWTWGYEDILKAVSKAFGCKIHVDRYKKVIYSSLQSDPLLNVITTEDPYSTRFHACERFNRCACVPSEDSEVVYVNAVECPVLTWDVWRKATQIRLLAGERVKSLIVPLARHSTLPELQHFVSIFKPKRVVPNTVLPRFRGADWACIPVMFRSSMAPGGAERVMEDMRANGYSIWADVHLPLDKGRSLISSNSAGLISQDDPVDLNGHSFTAASRTFSHRHGRTLRAGQPMRPLRLQCC
ncbi:hypothetical protein BS47DRAFT_822800 [Hydnum rufescens UP504]|uniref:Protein artemis n=1 Tax=Hydnum rufescens UP504 TaxID=1448309 RepID=A0A9P6AZS0_9AGAM|nr:hypothetical protein BS47DRAFT_822800 [Hydnum rufescens UP504]